MFRCICSMSTMDGNPKNRQQWSPNVVVAVVSIQPYLSLPKVVALTQSNSYEGTDRKVYYAVRRAALKISPTKIERFVFHPFLYIFVLPFCNSCLCLHSFDWFSLRIPQDKVPNEKKNKVDIVNDSLGDLLWQCFKHGLCIMEDFIWIDSKIS